MELYKKKIIKSFGIEFQRKKTDCIFCSLLFLASIKLIHFRLIFFEKYQADCVNHHSPLIHLVLLIVKVLFL